MPTMWNRIGLWVYRTLFLLIPAPLFAALNDNLLTAGKEIKTAGAETGGASLPALIGKLINAVLSVLGLVFVVLVVYAGYLWMTDAGEGKKVEKAKALLGTAIIGLVIIVAAYAISAFVIGRISNVGSP